MQIPEFETEAAHLILPRFDESVALDLGLRLVDLARARNLPVVIDIRDANRTYFHAAMPGSAPLNDLWARRKSATALIFHEASLLVGRKNAAKGETVAKHGLDPAHHADHGGAVPLRVQGGVVAAVATVSGLPQVDDHKLVVEAIRSML